MLRRTAATPCFWGLNTARPDRRSHRRYVGRGAGNFIADAVLPADPDAVLPADRREGTRDDPGAPCRRSSRAPRPACAGMKLWDARITMHARKLPPNLCRLDRALVGDITGEIVRPRLTKGPWRQSGQIRVRGLRRRTEHTSRSSRPRAGNTRDESRDFLDPEKGA
jgi:hypothetical protein